MSFTRNVLIATGHSFLPQLYGGAQTSTDDLANLIIARCSAKASVSAQLLDIGRLGAIGRLKMKLGAGAARDRSMGYPVFRAWSATRAAEVALQRMGPDLAIVQSMGGLRLVQECQRHGVPTIFYFHNVEGEDLGGRPLELRSSFVANSHYTAKYVEKTSGIKCRVIPPIFHNAKYEVDKSKADSVLFVNPVPEKGVDRAIAIASLCPHIPFVFAEAWWSSAEKRRDLALKIGDLANISVVPSQRNMTSLYGRARVLLLPSVWNEAWGRVASEAQMSGTPVLASNVGGISESVGPGGVLMPTYASDEEWASELSKLWDKDAYYDRIAKQAKQYSLREELSPAWQLHTLGEAATDARRYRKN